eukprot:364392-Chlamydomonas_euryale.AAC.1
MQRRPGHQRSTAASGSSQASAFDDRTCCSGASQTASRAQAAAKAAAGHIFRVPGATAVQGRRRGETVRRNVD